MSDDLEKDMDAFFDKVEEDSIRKTRAIREARAKVKNLHEREKSSYKTRMDATRQERIKQAKIKIFNNARKKLQDIINKEPLYSRGSLKKYKSTKRKSTKRKSKKNNKTRRRRR